MATVALSKDTFSDTIKNSDVLLMDFWADWCGPCQRFGPIFEAASEEHPDVVFAKVDTDAERELAAAFEIRAIPTIMAFRNGHLVFRESNVLSRAQVNSLIDDVKALDPAELDKQAAAARAASGADSTAN